MTPLPELEPAALDAARKAVGRRLGTAMWPDAEEAIRAYLSAARSTVPWTPEFDAMVAADPILSRAASIICGVACGSYSHCLSREAAVALRDAGLLASVPAPSGAAERNTHLLEWLNDGWTHCQHGTREWCEGYLHNARDVIRAQDAALTASEAEATSLRRWLGELLAVIHRDGGHHQEFAGTEQAVADAQSAVVLLFQAQEERDGEEWVNAHANEVTAVDEARRWKGKVTSLYANAPQAVPAEDIAAALAEVDELERYGNATSRHIRAALTSLSAERDNLKRRFEQQLTRADQKHEWAIEEAQKASAAERKLEEHRRALEPFEELADEGNDDQPDDTKVVVQAGRSTVYTLRLSDLRRARDVYRAGASE